MAKTIADLSIPRDKEGKIAIKDAQSEYQPEEAVVKATQIMMTDFEQSVKAREEPYNEFGGLTLQQRTSEDRKIFNSFQPSKESLPNEEQWKSQAIRPIARNKAVSIAAHVTNSLMYPQIFAQTPGDQEDKDAATVMRDLMDWTSERSDYEQTFLFGVISALSTPAVITHTEFSETYRNIKEIQVDGSWEEKEVIDELFSGFNDKIVPVEELYIPDFYTFDLQKEPHIEWRKVVDYSEVKAKYHDSPRFEYVEPGQHTVQDEETGIFYNVGSGELEERQVEEVIYWNRARDLRLVFLNGILVTEPDQPNPRIDKKYPFAKSGFEPINEGNFFYFKSLVHKLSPDQKILNRLYRAVIDGSFLKLMPPLALFGKENIDSSVMLPGTVTTFSKETTAEPLNAGIDLGSGLATLGEIESSMSESSHLSPTQQGQVPSGRHTAYEVRQIEQSTRTMLGLFGRMIAWLVKRFGELRVSDILQFLTVGEVMETIGEANRVRFRNFVIPDRHEEGQTKTRRIEMGIPNKGQEETSRELAQREQELDENVEIYKVNPVAFRQIKFQVKVAADIKTPLSDSVQKALNLELYDRAIRDPNANQKAVYQNLLLGSYEKTQDNVQKYTKETPNVPIQEGAQAKGGNSELMQLIQQGQ